MDFFLLGDSINKAPVSLILAQQVFPKVSYRPSTISVFWCKVALTKEELE